MFVWTTVCSHIFKYTHKIIHYSYILDLCIRMQVHVTLCLYVCMCVCI